MVDEMFGLVRSSRGLFINLDIKKIVHEWGYNFIMMIISINYAGVEAKMCVI